MGTVEERIVIDFGQAVGALRMVAAESTKTAAAVGSVGTSSRAASAGAVNLGNQLADVAAQMSTGANPFTIAVQQGPQAAAALAQMGSAGVMAGGALAALSAVVVAGGAAWRIYSADERIAEQVALDLTAAHAELRPLLDSTRRATIDLAEATGQLSPLMADLERNSLRALTAWGNATDETRAKLAALRREQESVTTQIIDAGQAFYDAIDPTGLLSEGYQRLYGGSRELQTEIDALSGAVDQSVVALRENRQVTEQTAIADEAAKRAKEAHTESARAQKDALAELKKAQDELWNSLKRENEERKIAVALANAEAALAFSRGTTSEAAMQRVGTAGRMAELQGLDPRLVNDREAQLKAMTDLATTISLQDAATRENTAAVRGATEARAMAAANTAVAFGSGPSGFMSSIGPWGAIISGLIEMISNMEDTMEQFEAWHERALDGIAKLPEIYANKFPEMIERGTQAFVEMLPRLFVNIIENSGMWESGGGKMAAAFIKGIVNAGKSMFTGGDSKVSGGDVANFLLGGIPNLVKGQHDTGAVSIGRPGLYMLHGGERVLTSGQATSARNRGQGGGVTIQIGSVMGGRAGVRELVDLIRRESGPLGSRVSLGV